MNMYLSVVLCVLVIVNISVLPVLTYEYDERHSLDSRNAITDYSASARSKRMAKVIGALVAAGVRATKSLLRGSTRIYSEKGTAVYTKPGGYQEAIDDFYSIKPNDIELFGSQRAGVVGDRIIKFNTGRTPGTTTITVTKGQTNKSPKKTVAIIMYKQ